MPKFHTFGKSFNPSFKDCLSQEKLSHSIVPRMTNAVGADYFLRMRSTLYTIKSFPIAPRGLKLMRLQCLGVFQC